MTPLASLLAGAGVEEPLIEPLARYGEFVLEANRRTNLTGAKSPEELLEHLLDSLSVVPFVREPYVDVGSGAGFPAIPVAIATGAPLTLVESTAKKARFLREAIGQLGLAGEIVAERAERAAHDPTLRERFATATARAVAIAPAVAELLVPLLAVGGAAILQRGRLEEAERRALEDAALVLGARIESEHALEGDRRIVILRKERPTPTRFPRRIGIPEKRPLCL